MCDLNTVLPIDLAGIVMCFMEDPVQTLVVQELDEIKDYMDANFGCDNEFVYHFFDEQYCREDITYIHHCENVGWSEARELYQARRLAAYNRGWRYLDVYIQTPFQSPPEGGFSRSP